MSTLEEIRNQAVRDCKYAMSLGDSTLTSHLCIWVSPFEDGEGQTEDDIQYQNVIFEIVDNLRTDKCLLK